LTTDHERTFVDEVTDRMVKLFSSFLVGLVTVLIMYMIPFMPQNFIFTALVGGCVAILGYKSPKSSAFMASSIMIISMLYQLAYAGFLTFLYKGDFILVIFLWIICISSGSLFVDLHESLVAFSLSYLGFLMLFTSVWYLAIPMILLPSVLSRGFRTGFATIMFILLYLPFQITAYTVNNLGVLAQIEISEFAKMRPEVLLLNPPFDPTNKGIQTALGLLKPFAEPMSRLTLDEFFGKPGVITQAISGGSGSFFGMNLKVIGISTYDIYNNTMFVYMNNIGSIILLVIAIVLSISLAYITLSVLSRFKPKFMDPLKELIYGCFKPVISAIVSMALFIGLFSGLADVLNYVSPLLQSSIQFITMGFVIVLTALPSSVKTVLDYSKMKIKLEEEFLTSLKQYDDEILELKTFLNRLSKIDREIGIVALDNSLQTLSARTSSFSIKVSRLGLENLEEMRELINHFGEEVKAARDDVTRFANNYAVQKISLLKTTTLGILERGWLKEDDEIVKALEKFDEGKLSIQRMDEIESLLADITKVADTLTHRLMRLHEEIRVTLQKVFHVENKLIIDIEQSIIKSIEITLGEGKIWSALQIIRREIEGIEGTYSEKVQVLRSKLALVVETLKRDADKLVYLELKPLFAQRFCSFLSLYDGITKIAKEEVGGVISVIGLRKVLDNTRRLGLALTKTTYELIKMFQDDVAKKSPVDFDKLMLISNIRGPHELYEKMEKSLAIELNSGEEMISNLESVLNKDLLVLLELLRDYAILYERILNYPNAEAAILSILKDRKEEVSIEDLPFAREHSIWYMRLYAMRSDQSVELKGTEERRTLTRREK